MDIINRLIDLIGVVFNKRLLSRSVVGEILLEQEDIDNITSYLAKRTENNEGRDILINQLEQQKYPILKEFLVNELDIILTNNITLGNLQKFAVAKGGYAKGIASIVWDNETGRYIYKDNGKIKWFLIFLSSSFFLLLFFTLATIFKYSHMIFLAIPLFFFALYLLCAGSVNKDAGKYLKTKYPHLFET